MEVNLQGRTALITGGSKGLGLATALKFASSGASVAILARDKDALEHARQAITACSRAKVLAVSCDIADAQQCRDAYQNVRDELGPVDILVNNAGRHAAHGPFTTVTEQMWLEDLDLKLMAGIRMSHYVWSDMVERKWGRIINVLNTLSKAPTAGSTPTSVTRAAQLALTKVLSKEGAASHVLVNALLVGLIESAQMSRFHQDPAREKIDIDRIPMGRMGKADEFANAACFLASDAASYITGTAINVDGGMSPVI